MAMLTNQMVYEVVSQSQITLGNLQTALPESCRKKWFSQKWTLNFSKLTRFHWPWFVCPFNGSFNGRPFWPDVAVSSLAGALTPGSPACLRLVSSQSHGWDQRGMGTMKSPVGMNMEQPSTTIWPYLETPNALLFLPFRKRETLPGKRRLLMLPGVF
jgi:hypothetical protein